MADAVFNSQDRPRHRVLAASAAVIAAVGPYATTADHNGPLAARMKPEQFQLPCVTDNCTTCCRTKWTRPCSQLQPRCVCFEQRMHNMVDDTDDMSLEV